MIIKPLVELRKSDEVVKNMANQRVVKKAKTLMCESGLVKKNNKIKAIHNDIVRIKVKR